VATAGVINTLRYVQKLTGPRPPTRRDRRFSSQRTAVEPLIGPTCDAFAELGPEFLVPAHCTGLEGHTHALAARFSRTFLQNAVGTPSEIKSTASPV
jgi:7,8-dihydropterin-6-yl-methyl-4-(beta-D-ribofuranosyl)aminobenzene 5'-phosphate synthase